MSLLAYQNPLAQPTYGQLPAKLRTPLNTAIDLQQKARDAEDRVLEAQNAVTDARERDVRAGADAVRSGKSLPPRNETQKAQKALDDLEHESASLREAARSAREELLVAISENGGELSAELDGKAAEAVARAKAALGEADVAFRERSEALTTKLWLGKPTSFAVPMPPHRRALTELQASVAGMFDNQGAGALVDPGL